MSINYLVIQPSIKKKTQMDLWYWVPMSHHPDNSNEFSRKISEVILHRSRCPNQQLKGYVLVGWKFSIHQRWDQASEDPNKFDHMIIEKLL